MTPAEELKQELQAALGQVQNALQGLGEEERAQSPEGAGLLERVTSYVQLVVDGTDPELISGPARTALQAAIRPIADDPATSLTQAQSHADALVVSAVGFPAAQSRDMEQVAQEILANFERSASERLSHLHEQADDARSKLAALEESIATESTKLSTEIDAARTTVETTIQTLGTTSQTTVDSLLANVQAKVSEFDMALSTQRTAVEELRASQTEAFSTSQGERATTFQEELAKAREELGALEKSAGEEVEARVAEIRRMEHDAGGLVGSIALAGTADRYGEEAKDQKKVADTMRWVTVLLAVLAAGIAVVAATHKSGEWQAMTGKLAVSAVLGGIATYTGKQSARHRVREERARNLQLELTAFSPFIEPLSKEQQDFERVIMARKTFGQIAALPEAEDDHSFGPLGPVESLRNKLRPDSDEPPPTA